MGASLNLNHWADGAWADSSWVPESWGSEEQQVTVVPGGVRRKRRILPDGRHVFATEQEAVDILRLYYSDQKLKPVEAAVLGLKPNRTRKVIISPSEKIEIREALLTLEGIDVKTRRQEEEWLILFH